MCSDITAHHKSKTMICGKVNPLTPVMLFYTHYRAHPIVFSLPCANFIALCISNTIVDVKLSFVQFLNQHRTNKTLNGKAK